MMDSLLFFSTVSDQLSFLQHSPIAYLDGSTAGRQVMISVNGGAPITLSFTPTGSFNTAGTTTVTLPLVAGNNAIEFSNPSDYAPDFDRILVAATPS